MGNSAAIGKGPLSITGGALDNTSGGPLALSANNAQNWNGSFLFKGSNSLRLGSGTVTLGGAASLSTASAITDNGVLAFHFSVPHFSVAIRIVNGFLMVSPVPTGGAPAG